MKYFSKQKLELGSFKRKYSFVAIVLLFNLSQMSCDNCEYADCPIGQQVIHKINVIDADGKSVYASSSTQLIKSDVTVSDSRINISFEDSIIVLTQRFVVEDFSVNYNDTISSNIKTNYITVSSNDDCCSDYQRPNQVLVDNQALCDGCSVIEVEI